MFVALLAYCFAEIGQPTGSIVQKVLHHFCEYHGIHLTSLVAWCGHRFVAVFDGVSWSELKGSNSLNANNDIKVVTTDNNGDVYVAGSFKNSKQHSSK